MGKKHGGFGGLYFVTVNLICAALVFLVLELSWVSQAVAISDNMAYIVSINTAAKCYLTDTATFSSNNVSNVQIKDKSGKVVYEPNKDFQNMMKNMSIISSNPKISVSWNKSTKTAIVQVEQFNTKLGKPIRPHSQSAVIEDK